MGGGSRWGRGGGGGGILFLPGRGRGRGGGRMTRVAVVGAGAFGQNHCRIVHESERAELAAIVDTNQERAAELAARYNPAGLSDARELAGRADAAIVAVPTTLHADVGCGLL